MPQHRKPKYLVVGLWQSELCQQLGHVTMSCDLGHVTYASCSHVITSCSH